MHCLTLGYGSEVGAVPRCVADSITLLLDSGGKTKSGIRTSKSSRMPVAGRGVGVPEDFKSLCPGPVWAS